MKREIADYVEMMGQNATENDYRRFWWYINGKGLDIDEVFDGDKNDFLSMMKEAFSTMNWRVEDYETANGEFGYYSTKEEAEAACEEMEATDKKEGNYTPGWYAIRNLETDELERFNY